MCIFCVGNFLDLFPSSAFVFPNLRNKRSHTNNNNNNMLGVRVCRLYREFFRAQKDLLRGDYAAQERAITKIKNGKFLIEKKHHSHITCLRLSKESTRD